MLIRGDKRMGYNSIDKSLLETDSGKIFSDTVFEKIVDSILNQWYRAGAKLGYVTMDIERIKEYEAAFVELKEIKERAKEVIANLHLIDDTDPILHCSVNPRIDTINYILEGEQK